MPLPHSLAAQSHAGNSCHPALLCSTSCTAAASISHRRCSITSPRPMPTALQHILHGSYEFPPDVPLSPECKDLIQRILVRNPAQRITLQQVRRWGWGWRGCAVVGFWVALPCTLLQCHVLSLPPTTKASTTQASQCMQYLLVNPRAQPPARRRSSSTPGSWKTCHPTARWAGHGVTNKQGWWCSRRVGGAAGAGGLVFLYRACTGRSTCGQHLQLLSSTAQMPAATCPSLPHAATCTALLTTSGRHLSWLNTCMARHSAGVRPRAAGGDAGGSAGVPAIADGGRGEGAAGGGSPAAGHR